MCRPCISSCTCVHPCCVPANASATRASLLCMSELHSGGSYEAEHAERLRDFRCAAALRRKAFVRWRGAVRTQPVKARLPMGASVRELIAPWIPRIDSRAAIRATERGRPIKLLNTGFDVTLPPTTTAGGAGMLLGTVGSCLERWATTHASLDFPPSPRLPFVDTEPSM